MSKISLLPSDIYKIKKKKKKQKFSSNVTHCTWVTKVTYGGSRMCMIIEASTVPRPLSMQVIYRNCINSMTIAF